MACTKLAMNSRYGCMVYIWRPSDGLVYVCGIEIQIVSQIIITEYQFGRDIEGIREITPEEIKYGRVMAKQYFNCDFISLTGQVIL